MQATRSLCIAMAVSGSIPAVATDISGNRYFSANEGKIHLVAGAAVPYPGHLSDRLYLVDTETRAERLFVDVGNSVIGPPSSLTYSRESGWVLISDSVRLDVGTVAPGSFVSCIPFDGREFGPPQRVKVGLQPSGIDLDGAGETALVTNRMGGSISVLRLRSGRWEMVDTLTLASPEDEVTDVTILPDGSRALYLVRKTGALGMLLRDNSDGSGWSRTGPVLDLDGYPYRVVSSPDGSLAYINLASRKPKGNGSLAVVRIDGDASRILNYHDLGFPDPETVEISDCGNWLAIPLMAGSNLPEHAAGYSTTGRMVVLRAGSTPERVQVLECGAIPEGAAFSADALELVVQCHPAREIWVYGRPDVKSDFQLSRRIATTGFPSAMIPAR